MALNNRKSSFVMCFKSTFIEPPRFRQISLLITAYSLPRFKKTANCSKTHPQRNSKLFLCTKKHMLFTSVAAQRDQKKEGREEGGGGRGGGGGSLMVESGAKGRGDLLKGRQNTCSQISGIFQNVHQLNSLPFYLTLEFVICKLCE